jgi:hypothetical protein
MAFPSWLERAIADKIVSAAEAEIILVSNDGDWEILIAKYGCRFSRGRSILEYKKTKRTSIEDAVRNYTLSSQSPRSAAYVKPRNRTFGGPEMARTKKPRSSKPKRGSKTKKPHATSNSGMSKVRKNHWAAPSICGFSTSWPLLYGPAGGGSSCVFSGGAFEVNRRRH